MDELEERNIPRCFWKTEIKARVTVGGGGEDVGQWIRVGVGIGLKSRL